MAAPRLDPRSIGDVIRSAEELALGTLTSPGYVADWTGVSNVADPGRRAITLFARLMELLIERENRIPEKNFLRFLDFVGVEASPGTPARVPLTFVLAKDAVVGAIVPAGAQAATTQTETVIAQIFATSSEFFASAARIEKVIALAPSAEAYAELDLGTLPPDPVWLADTTGRGVTALTGSWSGLEPVPHVLYLADEALFGRDEPVDVTLIFTIATGDASALSTANVTWRRFDPDLQRWVDLNAQDMPAGAGEARVRLNALAGVGEAEVAGVKGYFVAGEIRASAVPALNLAVITSVKGLLDVSGGAVGWVPELAFANAQPLDLSQPFRPFGERPRYGDAFYLGSLTGFGPEVESVEIIADILPFMNAELVKMFTGITVAETITTDLDWQYLRADGLWQTITTVRHAISATAVATPVVSKASTTVSGAANVTITAGSPTFFGNPATDGADMVDFSIDIGADIGFLEVNGEEAYWIRAILRSKAPYGSDGFVIPGVAGTPATPPKFVGPLYVAPTVEKLEVVHTHRATSIAPATVITLNNFESLDRTAANAAPGGSFAPFVSLPAHRVAGATAPLAPEPAVYIGLDRKLESEFVSIFFDLDEATSQAVAPLESGNPRVAFEYFASGGVWKPLDVEEGTNDLTTSGTVAFLAPSDLAPLAIYKSLLSAERQLNPALFWLRVRLASGTYDRPPEIIGLYLNTVMAENRVAVTGDLLIGSANGKPRQQIQLVKFPVLAGDLWVREPERPSEAALEQLRLDILGRLQLNDPQAQLTADELVDRTTAATTDQDAIWVRWHRVPNFAASDEDSRHYTLDPVGGIVGFGDGRRGLIAPIARDNLVFRGFQSGGGSAARVAATPLAVKELKTSLPFISKVFNPARATGGSDAWRPADIMRFGPQSIRNRGRAVTTEDYEWMVQERFGQVAKVRCLATRAPGAGQRLDFKPGAVTAIVVPATEETLPRPSNGLLDEIRDYLETRTLGCIVGEVHVIGPTYEPVSIRADVHAISPREASAVQRRVTRALESWLHPIKGGDLGTGWGFGRDVYLSEVFAVIAAVPGVDYVVSALFIDEPAATTVKVDVNGLAASGTHEIGVV